MPAIQHILERLAPLRIPVVLAVPKGEAAEFLPFAAVIPNVTVFEGSPVSPLHRMHEAAHILKTNVG